MCVSIIFSLLFPIKNFDCSNNNLKWTQFVYSVCQQLQSAPSPQCKRIKWSLSTSLLLQQQFHQS